MVTKGIITQAQADKRLQTVQTQFESGKGKIKMMKGKGMHKGFEFGFGF